jgi:hypothetical protein
MFKAGQIGLLCAAYEVELMPGTETHKGSITPVRDCVNLATERVATGDCYTAFCPACAEAFANSSAISVIDRVIRRPEFN